MMKCGSCGRKNESYAQHCIYCGQQFDGIDFVTCEHCGTHLDVRAEFCMQCGSEVRDENEKKSETQEVQITEADADTEVNNKQPTPTIDYIVRAQPPQNTRLLIGLANRLKRYLPENLATPLDRVPNFDHLQDVRNHLVSLLRVIKTYVPHPVALTPQPPGTASGSMEQGAFLFADVKGFTTLYEKLMQQGEDGGEQITTIINDMFGMLVGILFEHGGYLIRFGGDAMLGLFPSDDEDGLPNAATLAMHASLKMIESMAKFAEIDVGEEEPASLALKIGVATGPYFSAHLGLADDMVFMAMGNTVNGAEQAEGYGEAGEVIIDPTTYNLVQKLVESEHREDDFHLLFSCSADIEFASQDSRLISEDEKPTGALENQIKYLLQRLEYLTPLLPANMLGRMVTSPEEASIPPDYRPVSILFINYEGFSEMIEKMGDRQPDVIAKYLNTYYRQVAGIVKSYDGSLARVDQYSVGDRFVVFFGAPNAHEDDPLRAVYAALDIQERTEQQFSTLSTPEGDFKIQLRIGINTGQLLAGNVGAQNLRQEYTLMGDDINMAARLMSKADWGEIFISDKTQENVASQFELEDKGELKVKGKEITIPTFAVTGIYQPTISEEDAEDEQALRFVGRDEELTQLTEGAAALLTGRGQIITIIGEPGIGKTRLLMEFRDKATVLEGEEGQTLAFYGRSIPAYREQSDNWLITRLIYRIIDVSWHDTSYQKLAALWRVAKDILDEDLAKDVYPFIAYLIEGNLGGKWGDWIKNLPPGVRKKQVFWALGVFLSAVGQVQPTILALDNMQWADQDSLDILTDLLRLIDHTPLMFLFLFRREQRASVWKLRDYANGIYEHRYTQIDLGQIDDEANAKLLTNLIPGARFKKNTQEQILNKSLGNPRYLKEILEILIKNELLQRNPENQREWRISGDIDEIPLPASLKGSLVSKIDTLLENSRNALLIAAIFGRTFPLDILRELLEYSVEEETWLSDLEREQIIRPVETDEEQAHPYYEFVDGMLQQVAYQSLLSEQRTKLHRRAGEFLEGDEEDTNLDTLAYHFGRSDDFTKANDYLMMAAERAMQDSVVDKASRHYNRLLDLLAEDQIDQRLHVLNMLQQTYELLGDEEKQELIIQTMEELKSEAEAEEKKVKDDDDENY